MTDPDIFQDFPDDDRPVSRGEMRRIVKDVRRDLKWTAAIIVVGGQTLSHVQLPPVAGFIGGTIIVSFGILKLAIVRN